LIWRMEVKALEKLTSVLFRDLPLTETLEGPAAS